jgi:hypothetical protein
MSEIERYSDPVLADRFKEWLNEAAPPAAPERLVFAVMDDVEASGRTRGRFGAIRFETILQWVALTVVIAIGVTLGSIVSRPSTNGSGSPSPSPGASASRPTSSSIASPASGAAPSLRTIDRSTFSRAPGPSAIGLAGSSMWVGTPDGEVVELDPTTGVERSRRSVGAEPITIIQYDGVLWIGSGGPDLAWLDPATGEGGTIPGLGGHVVLRAAGSLWVSRQGEFARLDPVTREPIGSISLPNHRASDIASIVGGELWAGSGETVARLSLPSGSVQGTISAQPDALLERPDGVYAVDRGRLVQLAGANVTAPLDAPVALLDDLPQAYGQAVDGDLVWFGGPMPAGFGEVVGIDLRSKQVISRTRTIGSPRALSFAAGSLWVALDDGTLLRLAVR